MFVRAISACLMALTLGACAYPGYVNDDYRYIPLVNFSHDNRSYRIFDKPSAGKLVITPSLAMAMSDSVIRGATWGRYNNTTPRDAVAAAVEAYLVGNGRKCTVLEASLIYDPQWEFTYSCEINYTAVP
jgi:hypothetical protein